MQADEPLGTFLDYCTYGHMIDNVVLLVTGTLHERDVTVSTYVYACYGKGHCILQRYTLLVIGSSHCQACKCQCSLMKPGRSLTKQLTHALLFK